MLSDLCELVRAPVIESDPEAITKVRDLDHSRFLVEIEESGSIHRVLVRTGAMYPVSIARRLYATGTTPPNKPGSGALLKAAARLAASTSGQPHR